MSVKLIAAIDGTPPTCTNISSHSFWVSLQFQMTSFLKFYGKKKNLILADDNDDDDGILWSFISSLCVVRKQNRKMFRKILFTNDLRFKICLILCFCSCCS